MELAWVEGLPFIQAGGHGFDSHCGGTFPESIRPGLSCTKLLRVHPLLQHFVVRAGSEMFSYLEIL